MRFLVKNTVNNFPKHLRLSTYLTDCIHLSAEQRADAIKSNLESFYWKKRRDSISAF